MSEDFDDEKEDKSRAPKVKDMKRELKEKDHVILRLINTVEKLEVLADLKKDAKTLEEEQVKATEDVRDLIKRGKRKNQKDHAGNVKSEYAAPALALSGVKGGLEAARKFERDVMKASTLESYMQPTMSNYAKQTGQTGTGLSSRR